MTRAYIESALNSSPQEYDKMLRVLKTFERKYGRHPKAGPLFKGILFGLEAQQQKYAISDEPPQEGEGSLEDSLDEKTDHGKDISYRDSRVSERKKGILIKDAAFEDKELSVLEREQLPLEEGCYLRFSQIVRLTGLSQSGVTYKLKKLALKGKEVSGSEKWYFVDASTYEKLLPYKNGPDNKEETEKSESQHQAVLRESKKSGKSLEIVIRDKNFEKMSIGAIAPSKLLLDEGCYLSAPQIQHLTGFSRWNVYDKMKRLEVERRSVERSEGNSGRLVFFINREIYNRLIGKISSHSVSPTDPKKVDTASVSSDGGKRIKGVSLFDVIQQSGEPGEAKPNYTEVVKTFIELRIPVPKQLDDQTLISIGHAKKLIKALKQK